jgi:Spy/CpxP family protein refolding chaperone
MKNVVNKVPALIFITSLLFCGVTAFGQQPSPDDAKREQIEAMRIAFITQKVDLTREEAQKFWPVYNEYRDALSKMRQERHDSYKNYKASFETLSDKEYTEYVDNLIIFRQRELDLMKKYHAEFKAVLPIKKVALLYRAEDEFKKNLLKEAHERKAD